MAKPYINLTGIDYSDSKKKYHELDDPLADPAVETDKNDAGTGALNAGGPKDLPLITPLRLYVAFSVLATLMMIWVWEATVVQDSLSQVERLKDVRLELEKTNEAIRVDITRLSGYERISKIATEQIGLVPATEKPGVIWIDPELLKKAGRAAADTKHE